MSQQQKARWCGWKPVGAGLALLGAAAFPVLAAAQQAQPANQLTSAPTDAITVVRDAETGKLRAPTAEELETMRATTKVRSLRTAPAATQQKFNANGAYGVRLTEEFVSQAVVVRNAKGGLDKQCLAPGHSAQGVHGAGSHINQSVEE
jgi:hypothetical protein